MHGSRTHNYRERTRRHVMIVRTLHVTSRLEADTKPGRERERERERERGRGRGRENRDETMSSRDLDGVTVLIDSVNLRV